MGNRLWIATARPGRPPALETTRRLSLILLIMVLGGCGSTTPAQTSFSAPPASPGATVSAAPPSMTAPPIEAPLTDDEVGSITVGAMVAIPADAPPAKVDAAAAEAIVRTTYVGERVTIEVRRIAMQYPNRMVVGWLVALSPRTGAPCTNHPGLLPRAIEGGIVDDQTGDMSWSMTCG